METNDAPVVAFFDVDGTLTCRDFNEGLRVRPTERVCEALHAFVERGNVAVVCTGRSPVAIDGLEDLPFSGYVTLDGTYVTLNDRVVYERAIASDVLLRTVEEMHRVGMSALIEGPHGVALVRNPGQDAGPFSDVPDFEDYVRAGGVVEFNKIDFEDASLAACRSSDFLMEHYTYLNVGEGSHELAIPGTSKGVGGRAFLDALPFAPSRVFAFGDSENDVEILKIADVAVVMGNARDVVKEHADHVTDHVRNDGVATALEHFGLI